MNLFDYQIETLAKLNILLKSNKEVVLAAAPNSGKTFMTTSFIKDNPTSTFLILTHGTVVLENQWREALETAGIPSSKIPGQHKVTYGLPQTLHKKKQKFDYLVVDEAHEFYFATMVQKIKKQVGAKKIILLTGTPSKFIKQGYPVITVAALDLIKRGHSSDLYIGMVSTTAKLKDADHNDIGDLSPTGERKVEKTIASDMKELLKQIQMRLTEIDHIKNNPLPKNTRSHWANSLNQLQKTMFKCSSIKQAELVQKYLKDEGVEALLSHSKLDADSSNIEKFKTDNSTALVVVDRAILGFNMTDLVNVVDLSCSKNIDRTYQLYARVMRKSAKYKNKYFFKFAPEGGMELHKWYMNAALSLMSEEFISKYNGKNLNKMNLPVQLVGKTRKNKNSKKRTPSTKEKGDFENIDKVFKAQVEAGAFLIDIENKIGQLHNEYAYVRFGQILGKVTEVKEHRVIDYTSPETMYDSLVDFGDICEE